MSKESGNDRERDSPRRERLYEKENERELVTKKKYVRERAREKETCNEERERNKRNVKKRGGE